MPWVSRDPQGIPPTLDALRRIANNLATSIDSLANDDETLPTDLKHHLAALNQLDPDEQHVIRTLIEATLLRHQARKLALRVSRLDRG